MFTKKDFTIKGRFTGNRLKGKENEFVYNIYTPNCNKLTDMDFTSKAEANKFLGEVLRIYRKATRK